MTSVGETLKELRESRGVTLRALAKEIGVGFSTISNVESEREGGSRRLLESLAEALDADVDVLLAKAGFGKAPFKVVGNIAAGEPIEAVEDIEKFDLTEHFDPEEHYLLRVRGDSMVLDGINDGDLAIVSQTKRPRRGQTVVAVVDGEEATLKRYDKKDGIVKLIPANRKYKAKTYPAAKVELRGVLVGVVRTSVK